MMYSKTLNALTIKCLTILHIPNNNVELKDNTCFFFHINECAIFSNRPRGIQNGDFSVLTENWG